MTTDHTRTTRERTDEPDALQRAKELAEKYIPLHDWDPVNEEPIDTYGYPETQRHGFQQGYLACHADRTARDAEPTTVTAEQIEKAAMDMRDNQSPAHRTDWPFRVWMRLARSAFRAAGFRIKGDEA